MTRRRIGFWVVLTLIAVLLAAGLWARHAWHELLQANNIEQLDWQGLALSPSSLTIDTFAVSQMQGTRQIDAHGHGLKLDWAWHGFGIQVTSLALEQLQLNVQTPPAPGSTPSPSLPAIPDEPPAWLPRQLVVNHFEVTLPCASGQCPLEGSLWASRQDDLLPAQAQLDLQKQGHNVQANITLDGTVDERLDATGNLSIDDTRTLIVQTRYERGGDVKAIHWSGSVDLPHLPRTDWLLDWVRQWQPLPVDDVPPGPDVGEISATWQLQWPAGSDVLRQATGSLLAQARIPQPWPLPGVGTLQGQFGVEFDARAGRWQAKTAQADLQLTQPANWVNQVPEPLRPKSVSLQIQPADPLPDTDRPLLPLQLAAQVRGEASLDINSHLALANDAPWLVKLGKTRIRGSLPRYTLSGWQLEQPALDLTVSGQVDTQAIALNLAPDSHLRVGQVEDTEAGSSLSISGLQAEFTNVPLNASYDLQRGRLDNLSFRGPVSLFAQRVEHSQLKPQMWEFEGDLAADLERLALNGRLGSQPGADTDVTLRYAYDGPLTLDASARVDGNSAGDAWAATLTAWPATLSVDQGVIEAAVDLTLPSGGPLAMESTVDADGLALTYNRMALTGMDGELVFKLNQNQLKAHTIDLRIAELNPGIPIGPLTADVRYESPLDSPTTGTLVLNSAETGLLGGEVHAASQRWNLGDAPIRIPLQVSNLQLSRLMVLYPAENLSGTGTLNGEIPVWIGPEGVHVENGRISAEEPGGRLRLPGERLAGIAQGNAAMQIVIEAVKNFHYSVLDSTIDYAKDGTLHLDLHIEGKNPNVRDGQQVVLNIDLEENIPALLTSLQLSGRVNEAVTERVRKLIEQQQTSDEPDLEIEGGIE